VQCNEGNLLACTSERSWGRKVRGCGGDSGGAWVNWG